MISRKRKIALTQLTIFLIASSLLYNTYRDKSEPSKEVLEIKSQENPNTNSFTDVEYSGFDLRGNRYVLNAGTADFKTESPELVDMKNVVANFYLKNGNVLKVISDEGLYNNITLDMEFTKNVKAYYLTNTLFSNKLTYLSSSGKLFASGNVRGESVEKGKFIADNVEYNLSNNNLDFSMLGDKQVNVKLKD